MSKNTPSFKHQIMKKYILSLVFLLLATTSFCQNAETFVNNLLSRMTLDEKRSDSSTNTQGADLQTGEVNPQGGKEMQIKQGKVGSMLNVMGVEQTRQMQELALQSRLRIPLLFGLDVIHGFRTTFPIPLAETASWDMTLLEKAARYAAVETAAHGVHWTFAPMVDIARDPRWGTGHGRCRRRHLSELPGRKSPCERFSR